MDIEKALMNELVENGTDKARDLFLKWQESRIQAKEMLLGKLEQVNETASLPIVSERPKFVKCSVTGLISVNQSGSSIGGGFWEYLYADEVAKLGIDPKGTKNADLVEGGR